MSEVTTVQTNRNWPYLALLDLWMKLVDANAPDADKVLRVAGKYRNSEG